MTKYPLIEAMDLKVMHNYDLNDSDNDFYYVHASSLEKALQASPVIYSGNPHESWIALKNNATIEPLTLDGRAVFEARVVCIQPIKKQTKGEAAIEMLNKIWLRKDWSGEEIQKILEMKD